MTKVHSGPARKNGSDLALRSQAIAIVNVENEGRRKGEEWREEQFTKAAEIDV